MSDHEQQPAWLGKLPLDVLNHIAQRTRDAITGLTTFRSVCRTWRAAVEPAPRLLPPSPQNATALHDGSDHALVFPLSRGWSIVVDPLDMSCHLSHLATGTTAVLPKLNDLGDGSDTSKITHLRYEFHSDEDEELPFHRVAAAPPDVEAVGDPGDQYADQDDAYFSSDEGSAREDQNEYSSDECVDSDDNAPSLDEETTYEGPYGEYSADLEWNSFREDLEKHIKDYQEARKDLQHKVVTIHDGRESYNRYMEFSNHFRVAIHVPPSTVAGGGCTEGIVIMMYHHWLHARANSNGMVFCRPGDATWTKINNPNPKGRNFVDFAYFDGKMFALSNKCVTLAFDATTLDVLYQVDVPPATSNFSSKMGGRGGMWEEPRTQCLHFVALPHKLLLVKVFMDEDLCQPVDFHVFELRQKDPNNGLAWCKVEEGVGGNYELFLDSYHATYCNSGDGSGTRIYHADNELFGNARCVWGYCYSMQDNKLECIHEPDRDDHSEYSTS